jgi:hypothetical protein
MYMIHQLSGYFCWNFHWGWNVPTSIPQSVYGYTHITKSSLTFHLTKCVIIRYYFIYYLYGTEVTQTLCCMELKLHKHCAVWNWSYTNTVLYGTEVTQTLCCMEHVLHKHIAGILWFAQCCSETEEVILFTQKTLNAQIKPTPQPTYSREGVKCWE